MNTSSEPILGDRIKVEWPEASGCMRDATVVKVKRAKDNKHGSNFKYTLSFDADSAKVKTRLLHLKWKPMKKKKIDGIPSEIVSNASKRPRQSSSIISPSTLKYILAPMVGASELAFRLLCRKYGATLCYTPMINSDKFAVDSAYRAEEFQTNKYDRPLVAHFSANNPQALVAAAKHVESHCDAIGKSVSLAY